MKRKISMWLPLVLTLAACGSTVQQRTGSTLAAGGLTAVSPGQSGQARVNAPGSIAPGDPSLTAPGPAVKPLSSTVGGSSSPSFSGATHAAVPVAGSTQPVKVGVVYANNAALATTFGVKNADASTYAKEIIDYINKTGGIAGRRLQAVFYQEDSSQDANTQSQAACAAFTQDTHVDIVVAVQSLGDQLPSCLQHSGIAMIDALNWTSDLTDMRSHPNYLVPVAMRVDRAMGAVLALSASRGVLKKGDTLGVLYEDCPFGPRVTNNVIAPFANKLGVAIVQASFQCVKNLVGDLGPVASQVQQAVLKFSTNHVTHVIVPSAAEAFAVAEFTKVASQQHYYPKYLVDSNAYPFNNSQSDAIVQISSDALPNMSGAGFIPLFDVGSAATPANAAQLAAQRQCAKADPDLAGSTSISGGSKYFNRNTAYSWCSEFFALKALLEANGVRYSLSDITRGYFAALNAQLGCAVLSGGYYRVGPDHLDGAQFMRPFAYSTSQHNFTYVGPDVSVP